VTRGAHDPPDRAGIETEIEPTVAGRLARWAERSQHLRTHVEAARVNHASIDFGFGLAERDASIGGGLLAGALATGSSFCCFRLHSSSSPVSASTPVASTRARAQSPRKRGCTD